jgi:hypothetical protein
MNELGWLSPTTPAERFRQSACEFDLDDLALDDSHRLFVVDGWDVNAAALPMLDLVFDSAIGVDDGIANGDLIVLLHGILRWLDERAALRCPSLPRKLSFPVTYGYEYARLVTNQSWGASGYVLTVYSQARMCVPAADAAYAQELAYNGCQQPPIGLSIYGLINPTSKWCSLSRILSSRSQYEESKMSSFDSRLSVVRVLGGCLTGQDKRRNSSQPIV